MRASIGPYRVGDQVYACSRWMLLNGIDSRDGSRVWVRRTHQGPRRGAAARALLGELPECDFLARPVALASDEGALVAIDPVSPEWSPLARSTPLATDAQVRAAYGVATAVDCLHAAGYAHGGIGEWTVDLNRDGDLRLRGAAEAVGELDRVRARRDICAVVEVVERIGGGTADLRIAETLTALSAGRAGLAELIAVTAAALQIEPTAARPPGADPPLRRRAHEVVAGVRTEGRSRIAPGTRPPNRRDHAPRHAAPSGGDGRRLAAVAMLVLGVFLAAFVLWPREQVAVSQAAPSAAASSASPRSGEDGTIDWTDYLPALYETRAEAFSTGNDDLLAEVYAPGSPQLRADAETIAALESQQRVVQGFAPTVLEVYDVQVDGDAATVRLRDEIGPFVIVDATGTEMPVEGRKAEMTTLTMRQIDGTWLIDTAHRAAD